MCYVLRYKIETHTGLMLFVFISRNKAFKLGGFCWGFRGWSGLSSAASTLSQGTGMRQHLIERGLMGCDAV